MDFANCQPQLTSLTPDEICNGFGGGCNDDGMPPTSDNLNRFARYVDARSSSALTLAQSSNDVSNNAIALANNANGLATSANANASAALLAANAAGNSGLNLTLVGTQINLSDVTSILATIDISSLLTALLPPGSVIMWAGSTVPIGWALCDGTSGRPDPRDKFVIGASATNTIGSTGGTSTHSHAITIDQALTGITASSTPDIVDNGGTAPNIATLPITINDPGHIHTGNASQTSNLPPFYALSFIIKL